jgi:hypothetical protein
MDKLHVYLQWNNTISLFVSEIAQNSFLCALWL